MKAIVDYRASIKIRLRDNILQYNYKIYMKIPLSVRPSSSSVIYFLLDLIMVPHFSSGKMLIILFIINIELRKN